MSSFIAVAADLLVAVLLAVTIVTSLRLSRRIRGLKADESAMRATIAELVGAADTAERAVAGLRMTLADSERTLGAKLREAKSLAAELDGRIGAGTTVLDCVGQIADISRRVSAPPPRERPDRAETLRHTGSAIDDMVARLARRSEERAA